MLYEYRVSSIEIRLFLHISKDNYSCAIRTADYIVPCHKNVNKLGSYIHKAAPATIGRCFTLLFFNNNNSLSVISFCHSLEYIYSFRRYGLCQFIPFLLGFLDSGLMIFSFLLCFCSRILEFLFLFIYFFTKTVAFSFIGLYIFH